MAIRRRNTEPVRVVSFKDIDALKGVEDKRLEKYSASLNIDDLGDLKSFKVQPSVFTVAPLKSTCEYMVRHGDVDWWGIFQNHVVEVTNIDFDLKKDASGVLADDMHDKFEYEVIKDIADIIYKLANRTSEDPLFFSPVGFWAGIRVSRSVDAKRISRAGANLVGAKAKS